MIRDGFHKESNVSVGSNFDCGYGVVLRENCIIGDNVSIWSNSVIDPYANIGNGSKIHVNVYVCQYAIIGRNVFIGPGALFLNDKYPPRYNIKEWEPPVIGNDVVIGGGAIICPGVIIPDGTIIGAGAVVVRPIKELHGDSGRIKQVWLGIPAERVA